MIKAKAIYGYAIGALACLIVMAVGIYYVERIKKVPAVTSVTTAAEEVEWKTYSKDQLGFSFQYPDDLVTALDSSDSYLPFIDGENRVSFNFPLSYTLLTGLIPNGTGISVGVSDKNGLACYKMEGRYANYLTVTQKQSAVINGLLFNKLQASRCGAAECENIYQYSIVKNDRCYRADLAIDEGPNPGQETEKSDLLEAQVENRLKSIFQRIIGTFVF